MSFTIFVNSSSTAPPDDPSAKFAGGGIPVLFSPSSLFCPYGHFRRSSFIGLTTRRSSVVPFTLLVKPAANHLYHNPISHEPIINFEEECHLLSVSSIDRLDEQHDLSCVRTVLSSAEGRAKRLSKSWRRAVVFLPLPGSSTHSISSFFDNRSESSKLYHSRSRPSNSGQFRQCAWSSSTTVWMLGVTTHRNPDSRLSSKISLIFISAR